MTQSQPEPAIWFPTLRAGTGTDVFTEQLVAGLTQRGIQAHITWLPLRAEYAPWTVPLPKPPSWATIAHVNTWMHSRLLPRQLPTVATIHHAAHHPDLRPYKGIARTAYHRCWIAPNERRVLRRAAHVIAVSEFVAETTRQTLLDVPMDVIHNGVDTEQFHPPDHRRPQKPFRLLYIGKWARLKGVDLLPPVMRQLGNDFELRYTAGPAADKDRAGMPENMHDLGRLQTAEQVIAAMHNADAMIFPSRSEGFGLVLIEAMACGLPVIATRGSSMVEVVSDPATGLLCPRDDTERFVAACRKLADDSDLCRKMAESARDRVVKSFSIESMIDRYLELYRGIQATASNRGIERGR